MSVYHVRGYCLSSCSVTCSVSISNGWDLLVLFAAELNPKELSALLYTTANSNAIYKYMQVDVQQNCLSVEGRPYLCTVCEKLFIESTQPVSAQWWKRVFVQQIWEKFIITKDAKPAEMWQDIIHTVKYTCTECGRYSQRSYELMGHGQIHSGLRRETIWMSPPNFTFFIRQNSAVDCSIW